MAPSLTRFLARGPGGHSHPDLPRSIVRPLRRGETAPLLTVFAGLSPESVYLRYHGGLARLTPSTLHALTDLHSDHQAFVLEERGHAVGIGRWHRLPGGGRRAEVAMEVTDHAQGRGLGKALAAELLRSSASAGIETLVAHVLADNIRVAAWLQDLGATSDPDDPDRVLIPNPSASERVSPECRRLTSCGGA